LLEFVRLRGNAGGVRYIFALLFPRREWIGLCFDFQNREYDLVCVVAKGKDRKEGQRGRLNTFYKKMRWKIRKKY
jgi:hypothetical protein